MGWWWSSSSPVPSTEVPTTIPDLAIARNDTKTDIPMPPSQPLSREENADRDLESFIAALESDAPAAAVPSRPQNNLPHWSDTPITPAPSETLGHYAPSGTTTAATEIDLDNLDITPQALYPRTMSCRQAFDQAFYCQSMGGKFNDLYRYGGLKSCSEHWSQFWFCMRVRTMGDLERERQTAEWYEARDERIKKERGGSSEDVWDIRTVPVKKAFWKNPDEVTQT